MKPDPTLLRVTTTRSVLVKLLSDGERRRPHCWGSDEFDWSIEDPAREIAAHVNDPRAPAVAAALADFQSAINAALTHAIVQRWPQRFAEGWLRTQPSRGVCAILRRDTEAEVLWILRGIFAQIDDAAKIRRFASYAFMSVKTHLEVWLNRRSAPVEVPRRIARDRTECESLDARAGDTGSEEDGDPADPIDQLQAMDPMMMMLEGFWDRAMSDAINREGEEGEEE